MWLDPMPLEDDIHKAYLSYYTHVDNFQKKRRIAELSSSIKKQILLSLLRLTPIYMERKEFNQMYLGRIIPGKLLGVGCGNGARLAQLEGLGWSVEGQEVDPVSASIAIKNGIKVHLGLLENLNLTDASYDAIVIFHVIEHVHDPLKLLAECKRLLSQNGTLIAITPNTCSYGHRIFKSGWRGLEPPRHLFLFSQKSLRLIANNVGFENPNVWTTAANAHHFALRSLNIIYARNNHRVSVKILLNFCSKMFLIAARIIQIFDKDSGEECVLMLKKGK